jgi:pyrrolysine biosynthesis protein PylD
VCFSKEEIKNYLYILDATNEGDWLTPDLLHENVIIAAPGVPLSLTKAALEKHGGRLVHDLLHIGTLSMVGGLCR